MADGASAHNAPRLQACDRSHLRPKPRLPNLDCGPEECPHPPNPPLTTRTWPRRYPSGAISLPLWESLRAPAHSPPNWPDFAYSTRRWAGVGTGIIECVSTLSAWLARAVARLCGLRGQHSTRNYRWRHSNVSRVALP